MKWVEIINLRSSVRIDSAVIDEIVTGISESDYSTETWPLSLEVKTYYQSLIETDFSIHIYWESETVNQSRSPLAIRIYSALLNMGLLDYSVWVERSSLEFQARQNSTEEQTYVIHR